MIFERTHNEILIQGIIRDGFDRPAMLRDGADPMNAPMPGGVEWILARADSGTALGVFCVEKTGEVHCCLLPKARGKVAIEVCRQFLEFLLYPVVTARIPAYNKPMLWVAAQAGMKRIGIEKARVPRGGALHDQVVFERRVA
jgi:RimJ/RimL family protein N-acetyltransferase